jgi:hypothetical protein
MRLRPRNWSAFQHYKRRNPPWVKLHKDLLDDFEFQSLPLASRALAPMLWLIASETSDGMINAEDRILAFRLRATVTELEDAIGPLIQAGFFIREQGDGGPPAPCQRDATPETETEAETKKKELPADAGASKPNRYLENFEAFWKAYPTDSNMAKKPAFRIWRHLSPEQRQAAIAAIPGFKRYCEQNKSWYRPIYAERFLSQEKFEGYAAEPEIRPEQIGINKDRADRLMQRGKYAVNMQ